MHIIDQGTFEAKTVWTEFRGDYFDDMDKSVDIMSEHLIAHAEQGMTVEAAEGRFKIACDKLKNDHEYWPSIFKPASSDERQRIFASISNRYKTNQ